MGDFLLARFEEEQGMSRRSIHLVKPDNGSIQSSERASPKIMYTSVDTVMFDIQKTGKAGIGYDGYDTD